LLRAFDKTLIIAAQGIREAVVEDAASKRILVQNTPKDIDCHRVLIQNSR
jgi:hypothetical protein